MVNVGSVRVQQLMMRRCCFCCWVSRSPSGRSRLTLPHWIVARSWLQFVEVGEIGRDVPVDPRDLIDEVVPEQHVQGAVVDHLAHRLLGHGVDTHHRHVEVRRGLLHVLRGAVEHGASLVDAVLQRPHGLHRVLAVRLERERARGEELEAVLVRFRSREVGRGGDVEKRIVRAVDAAETQAHVGCATHVVHHHAVAKHELPARADELSEDHAGEDSCDQDVVDPLEEDEHVCRHALG
mmetsp:Transcript_8862/g.17211  ORF Transcript_8862/g.17211 Transcript_8862/m.17211 type:complete len:237 (-) Transcript_8862:161-871(-)